MRLVSRPQFVSWVRKAMVPFQLVAMGVATIFWSIPVILVTPLGRAVQDRMVWFWARSLLKIAGIRVTVKGLNHLPPEGALLVFNHSSLLDIPAMHAAINKSFRFGAKAELFRIPIFGMSMKMAGALEIPRQNLSKAIHVYDRAVGRMTQGESFALAPEGTRMAGHGIGPFKTGPFVLAIKAQAPVIPVVIRGARELMGPRRLWLDTTAVSEIQLEVLPPHSAKNFSLDERDEMRSQVWQAMARAFEVGQ